MATAYGPYTPAVRAGDLLFCSGQLGADPVTNDLVEGTLAQTRLAIANLEALLAEHGATLDQMVKTTIFLTDMSEFAAMNEVYVELIPEPRPARSCVQVAALPKGASFEIEAIAYLG